MIRFRSFCFGDDADCWSWCRAVIVIEKKGGGDIISRFATGVTGSTDFHLSCMAEIRENLILQWCSSSHFRGIDQGIGALASATWD